MKLQCEAVQPDIVVEIEKGSGLGGASVVHEDVDRVEGRRRSRVECLGTFGSLQIDGNRLDPATGVARDRSSRCLEIGFGSCGQNEVGSIGRQATSGSGKPVTATRTFPPMSIVSEPKSAPDWNITPKGGGPTSACGAPIPAMSVRD